MIDGIRLAAGKAVEVALELLEQNPTVLKPQPPDPVRVRWPK